MAAALTADPEKEVQQTKPEPEEYEAPQSTSVMMSKSSPWMKGLGELETPEPPPEKEKEKANVSPQPAPKDGEPGGKVVEPAKPAEATAKPTGETAPAKPAESAKPADGDEDSKFPKTRGDWDRWKEARAQERAKLQTEVTDRENKIKELEQKLTQAATEAPPKNEDADKYLKEIEGWKSLVNELTEKITILDVREDPRFKKYFDDKVNAQINLAKRIVGTEKADEIAQALQLPDEGEFGNLKNAQIEQIMSELSPLQQSRLGSVLNSMVEINAERESEISKAKDLKTQKDVISSEQTKKAAAERKQLFASVVKSLQDKEKGFGPYQMRENDEAWNKGVTARVEKALKLITGEGQKDEDIMTAAMHAAAMPMVLESWKADVMAKDAEITKLKSQVAEMVAAQPRGGSTSDRPAGSEPPASGIKLGMSPMELSGSWAKKMADLARGGE